MRGCVSVIVTVILTVAVPVIRMKLLYAGVALPTHITTPNVGLTHRSNGVHTGAVSKEHAHGSVVAICDSFK